MASEAGGQTEIRVLSTLAVQVAWPEFVRRYEAAAGARIVTTFGPTNALSEQLNAGIAADVAVLTRAAADAFTAAGVLTGGVDIARSSVGLAVKAGAPRPDISTPEALIATLRGARAVAYSRIGASGVYFAGLIDRLGIAEAVNASAIVVPTGLTGTRLVSGEADVAIQQVSELMAVPGIDVVGPLPRTLQEPTVFSAALLTRAAEPALARRLIALLASAEARPILAAAGLEPM